MTGAGATCRSGAARRFGPFPEIVQRSGAGLLFETEAELVAALAAIQDGPGQRANLSRAALAAFDTHWREDRVIARYGAAFGAVARRKGDVELAEALEATL